jgi:uncharacterized protein DUF4386
LRIYTAVSTATVAGLFLIVVPIAFNAAFALLGARFDYPDILRRPTDEVLARFRAGGAGLLVLWWGFALTAVLLAPLVVLLSRSLDGAEATLLAVATVIGILASATQFLGLIRWPFLVPYWPASTPNPTSRPLVARPSTSSSSRFTATSGWRSASTSDTA